MTEQLQTPCFSWEGEDVLAWKIMNDRLGIRTGRYVDIGAHHPIQLSNTYLFYRNGWRGLNIDARPGSMGLFEQFRPEDTNLELGVSATPGIHQFYRFENATLDGILNKDALRRQEERGFPPIERISVQCERIDKILDTYLGNVGFELLSIDIEGNDFEVLSDLDLERWRPAMIICEILGADDLEEVLRSDTSRLLSGRDYCLFSRLHFSSIFLDRRRTGR